MERSRHDAQGIAVGSRTERRLSAIAHIATLSCGRVVRCEWPGKFTEVYSPAHNDFRPPYFEETALWFGFEVEFATSDSEACDRIVIGISR